jgi:hypothetical protein
MIGYATGCKTWASRHFAVASIASRPALSRKLSSAGEFHSHALPEPDVNLSIHPAPIV